MIGSESALRWIREYKKDLELRGINGSSKDWSEHRYIEGIYKGLADVESEIIRLNKDEDEDE